jgi:hypothetical protein
MSNNTTAFQPLLHREDRAAAILDMKVKTLQYLRVAGGGPPFVKIGRLVRYRHEDLLAFIEANRKFNTCK